MDCYIIPPIEHLELMHRGDSYFCLAHLAMQSQVYKNFFKMQRMQGKFVTLDNGAAEKSLVTERDLLDLAEYIMPNEVISPDVLFDKEKTLKNLGRFIELMRKRKLLGKIDIFAVPQGQVLKEWLDCYQAMVINEYVKVIGLSKIATPRCWLGEKGADINIAKARRACIAYLVENDLLRKPIHCLGMGDPTEFTKKVYKNPFIRSTDSCYTVLAAINGIQFGKDEFKRVPTPADYFDQILIKEQILVANKNISYLKMILRKAN